MTSQQPSKAAGFTLPELLIATAISLITAAVAGDLLISHIRTGEQAEALERQRSDWSRTTNFLEAEVALSERVFVPDLTAANPLPVALPSACNLSINEVRLELDLRRDLPPVIYGVKPSSNGWMDDTTLWRCGPSINVDGSYRKELSLSPILDGLDGAAEGGGLTATTASNNKTVNFILALKGHARITYRQQDSARSRITPLYSRPSENSLCDASNLVKLEGSSSTADNLVMAIGQVQVGEDVLICGRGFGSTAAGATGDTITGSDDANDILEGGDYGQATLNGLGGNDVLRGTLEADELNGGSGNDTLVGRGGNDQLNGGTEENSYLPGEGNDTVTGGSGLDIVFYSGPRSDYSLSGGCSKASCTVTASGASASDGSDTLTGVEILIFNNARVDLPE